MVGTASRDEYGSSGAEPREFNPRAGDIFLVHRRIRDRRSQTGQSAAIHGFSDVTTTLLLRTLIRAAGQLRVAPLQTGRLHRNKTKTSPIPHTLPADLSYSGQVMRCAFVVRLGPKTKPSEGRFEGSVEEVDTGKELRFRSRDELLNFIGERFQAVVASDLELGKTPI